MRVRLKFSKHGPIRFIGHLDTLRYFQKAIARAKVPVKYSEGFHPHQLLSFAMPLSVGVESDGEYLDMELLSSVSYVDEKRFLDGIINDLNDTMDEGIKILSAKVVPEGEKNAMASVSAASYQVWYKNHKVEDPDEFSEKIMEIINSNEPIIVTKKTKKSEKEIDLKPHILTFSCGVSTFDETMELRFDYFMMLSAGSENNIKPQLLMDAIHKRLGMDPEEYPIVIKRCDLFMNDDEGAIVPLINDLSE